MGDNGAPVSACHLYVLTCAPAAARPRDGLAIFASGGADAGLVSALQDAALGPGISVETLHVSSPYC